MLRSSAPSYVCWRCLAQGRNSSLRAARPSALRQLASIGKQPISTQPDASGSSQIPNAPPVPSGRPHAPSIRDRLRNWAPSPGDDNPGQNQQLLSDTFLLSKVTNSSTRAQATGSSELDHFVSKPEGMAEVAGSNAHEDSELAVVGSNTRSPGDLVEMKQTGSRTPIFAVYLGYLGDRHHFYASNGRWVISMGFSSIFAVSNFASSHEIRPILATIPKAATPDEFEVLRQQDKGPSREVGADLILRMRQFTADADRVYQQNRQILDNARSTISKPRQTRYRSLFAIADLLLPQTLKQDDAFPPYALYAVHTALYRNDFIFRPLSPSAASHRKDHIFEVFPLFDVMLIERVSAMVREYTLAKGKNSASTFSDAPGDTALGAFISRAREAVHQSRLTRQWTPHGILSPSSEVTVENSKWSPSSREILKFLEWWACYDLFEESARFHAYGSLILRALGLYPGATLDQSTAWTFLQETGVIPSWEVPSRYKVRLPETKIESGGGLARLTLPKLETSLRPDVAAGARKEWANDTIFCIDAPSTMLIDDGVSLERTDEPGEFWIHVHTADPASGIHPYSKLAGFMTLIPENIYLPGHFQAMLPADLSVGSNSQSLVDKYSLAAERPSLTFSAKVNELGALLDYKIQPGTVKNVVYLDPQDVSDFCNEPPPPASASSDSLEVGTPPDNATLMPNRPMTAVQDLDDSSKNDLLVLYRLSEALKKRRLDKGAWPYFFPRPSVSVAFDEASVGQETTPHDKDTRVFPPDPYIKVGYESSSGCSVVSNTMVLAGEIAARWGADRGIPLPYRKDVHSSTNFESMFNYATKEIYPLIHKGIEPKDEQREELMKLTGGIELSSKPGPYFLLGLDMYAKATSPLRRFADLMVHWQVHAALAYERKVQRAIDPAVDELDSILPFTSESLGLTFLGMREKMARAVARGSRDWILMALVRAWRFEKTFTRRLRFTVSNTFRQGLMGDLDFFGLDAVMDIDGLHGCMLVKDVRVGDRFEVELVDVNVHSRHILVKAVKYLGGGNISAIDDASVGASGP